MSQFLDNVRMTVSSVAGGGTGAFTVGSAVAGFRSFADASAVDGGVYPYEAREGTAWETGWGVYTASGTTLARTLVASSTGSLVTFTAAAIVSVVAHSDALRFKGAKVRKGSDHTANYTVPVNLTWDSEDYDTDAWHDVSSNTHLFTVPAGKGIEKVNLTLNFITSNDTADRWHSAVIWYDDGGGQVVIAQSILESGTTAARNCLTVDQHVDPAGGGIFWCSYQTESDTSITIETESSFSIRAIG